MPKLTTVLICLSLFAAFVACSESGAQSEASAPANAGAAMLETEDQKTLYAIGLMMAQQLGQLDISADELSTVWHGVKDGVSGGDPKVDINTYGPKVQEFAQARATARAGKEKEAATAFHDEMAATAGAERSDSGLIYIETQAGTGDSPAATDKVKVHYHGTLRDGTVFDSSVDRGQPIDFGLNQVIPCWTEGVQKMKVGGKAKLICPSDIAYGDAGRPPTIPGGATLVFEVELIEITPAG